MKKAFMILLLNITMSFAQDGFTLLTTVHGEKEGDAYSVVDAVGDVNGDGFDDFIVGGSSGEYVKLYFGGSPFDTLDCVRFVQGTWRRVSASGCGKGDLNGDGYNDFVINTTYFVDDHRVEIYYGGKDKKIYDNPDLVITNNGWYYGFSGRAINGDLNRDGYDDLIISAPSDDYDAHGRVYIYFGGKDMDTECDVFLEGKEPLDMFGRSVSIIGDTNGDGYDDLLIGASQELTGDRPGKAYLLYGGNDIGFNNSVEFVGTDSIKGDYGMFVSGLGDINGDGFKDFGIVSGNFVDIFSGKTLKKIFRITSIMQYWYPLNIIGGYDLNKDGYDDFIISYAHGEDQYAGGIALYLGSNKFDTVAALTLSGKTKNSYFGNNLAIGGDINNDGLPEIFVGENGELTQNGTIGTGTVYIYTYGKLNGIEESHISTLTDYIINQNYPNPFNPSTVISYSIPSAGYITLKVYDMLGRKVATLVDEYKQPGSYSYLFLTDNFQLSSGVYFYIITAGKYTQCRKMILLK
jgi:hypothetical protein